MTGTLQDQVAIVTGAASGIGRAIAHRMAREGAHGGDRRPRPCRGRSDRRRVRGRGPEGHRRRHGCQQRGGRSRPASPRRSRGFGRIDVLVSNAGIQIVHPLDEYPFADWKRMLAIHLDGAFLTTRACLKPMYAAGRGSIVYIGLGAFEGSVEAEGALCHGQARADRPGEGGGEGRGGAWRARQHRLPRLRAHAAGREADPRAGQGARHHRGTGDPRRDAEGDGGRRIHHRRGRGGGGAVLRRRRQQRA